jgi:hypothetical protein
MFRRFSIAFAVALVVQFVCLLCYAWIFGDALRLIRVIYRPFYGLADPLVRHYFGKSEGSLAFYAFGTVLAGSLVYSISAGLVAMCCFARVRKQAK